MLIALDFTVLATALFIYCRRSIFCRRQMRALAISRGDTIITRGESIAAENFPETSARAAQH